MPGAHGGEEVSLRLYHGDKEYEDYNFKLGPDDPKFIESPEAAQLNPSTRTYPVSWETNFVPYKVAVCYKKYGSTIYEYTWEEFYTQTTGLAKTMTIPVPGAHGGEEVSLRLYHGDTEYDDYNFKLGPNDTSYIEYPEVGLLDPTTRTYPVSWETNFVPYKVSVYYKYQNSSMYSYTWEEFYTQTTPLGTSMTIPVPGAHGGEEVSLRLYYGDIEYEDYYFKLVSQTPVVTFDPRGGTVDPTTAETNSEGKLGALPTPVRERYRFNYWYAYINGVYTIVKADTVFTRSTVAYASWTPIYHSVTIDSGSASRTAAEYGATISITANVKTGMTFTGWEVLSGGVTPADPSSASTTFVMGDGDVRIRANYEYVPVTVTFDPGDGSVTPSTLQTGADGKLPSIPQGVREGYVMAYWYYPVDDGTRTVKASTTFTQNTTCYACWSPRWYSVQVIGGSADCGTSAKTGQTVTVTAEERENYTFSSWRVGSGNVTLADASASTTTFTMGPGAVSLYANYTYTGEYMTDLYVYVTEPVAGDHPSEPYAAEETLRVTSCLWADAETGALLRTDSTFESGRDYLLRLYVAPGTGGLPFPSDPVGYVNDSAEGVTCVQQGMAVAKIEKTFSVFSSTVSFDGNGGTGSMEPLTVYSPAFTLPACGFTVPEDYEFTGWDAGQPGDEILLSGDITLTAQWRQIAGECGENLTWRYDSATGTLTISGEGDMTVYSSYTRTPWRSLRNEINTLIVENGVTSISQQAFFQQFALSRVILGDSVATIGSNAFAHCGVLAEINLPEGLTSIGTYAFYLCKLLEDVKLPASLVSVDAYAFDYCYLLRAVTVPEDVTQVGNYAFANCPALEEAVFLSENTTFGSNVFKSASTALSLSGYAGSTAEAYAVANGHTFVPFANGTLGDGVTWTVSPAGRLIISGSGPMADYTSATQSPLYSFRDQITSVVIEEGVTTVGAYVFGNCAMTSVSLPDSLTAIGNSAFRRCVRLDGIVIPSGVQTIPDTCFWGCSQLRNITLPDDLTAIGSAAFMMCSAIEDLYFVPESVENFGNTCFYGCTGLTAVSLPRGMTSVPVSCFGGCTNLISITVPSTVTEICTDAFNGDTNLSSVYYEGVRSEWEAIRIDETGNGPLLSAELFCRLAVVFDSKGGSPVKMQVLNANETAAEPDAPYRMGYIFDGWYIDDTFSGEAYDFTATVTEDITLFAKWIDPSAGGMLSLPAALTTLEDEAFSGVSATAVILAPSVTDISGNPFSGSRIRYVYAVPGSRAMIFAGENGLTVVPVDENWIDEH